MKTSRIAAALRRPWFAIPAYLLVFLTLDWISYIRPLHGLNITPWNPQPALAVALLMLRPRSLVLVWTGLLLADWFVHGLQADVPVLFAATGALALSYGGAARAMRTHLDSTHVLASRRDLFSFTSIVVAGSGINGALYLGTLAVGGIGPTSSLIEAIARYWVGDTVGQMVALPMFLVLSEPRRRVDLVATLRSKVWWAVAAMIIPLLVVIFWHGDREPFKFFYLLLLPVVWASARLGLSGAVLSCALTQVGLIVAMQSAIKPDLTVFELQVLMAALAMTGLMLGVAVDERERAETSLKSSLRLAAAGQMAAALAHELGQPLTALNSYAQASRLISAAGDLSPESRAARLTEVAERMADESRRASEVVKRLRDFFRSGASQLVPTRIESLVRDTAAAAQPRAQAQQVQLTVRAEPDLPELLVDPVQIAVALRNLVANAMDAVADRVDSRSVAIDVQSSAAGVAVHVRDSGPGVDAARVEQLLEPSGSDKPGGMGIGLSISRAIVEAHGGKLWAEAGNGGHFCLTLPVDAPTEESNRAP